MKKIKWSPNLLSGGVKKIFLFELIWFSLAQILGLLVARKLMTLAIERQEEIVQILPSKFSLLNFLASFLLVTVFILLVSKFSKGKNIIFKSLFILISFLGGIVFFGSFLPIIFALLFILIFLFFWFKNPSVWLHNLILIFGIAGIGGEVGLSLSPQIIIFLFLILAIYDIFAVYKTKHMVKIAKSMAESRAILGIILPQKFSDFNRGLKEVKIGDKKQEFLVLGAGDIVFPLILISSVLPQGISKSLIIFLFSLLGLLFGFWLFLKLGKKPMPALPPIALFSILGYLITRLI